MPTSLTYPGVYVQELPSWAHHITGVATSVTAFIGPARRGLINRPVRVASFPKFEERFGGLSHALETGYAVRQYFRNGGRKAWVVRVAKNPNQKQLQAGLGALVAVKLLNLLVLPGVTAPAAVALAAEYCQKRRAFLVVDAPARAKTPAEMEAAVRNLSFECKSHAAVYYPWIKIADPLNNDQPRVSPPSGTVAGMIARTDASRGVWKAPAGTEADLRNVKKLVYNLTDAEQGILNPRGINCLRSFPMHGIVVWGARTLAGDDQLGSEFKYIPVRRTALFIEESLDRGTKWAVFEPNDEPLWAQLRLQAGAFMHDLFRQHAFRGSSPKDAYFVKCDSETTSQTDRANGLVRIVVGFAPQRPAEFVVLELKQRAGQTA